MPHPDLAVEQAHIGVAYEQAKRMQARAAALAEREDLAANEVDSRILRQQFVERAKALEAATRGPLCFGRIDEGSARFHIGRTHVEDEEGNPLVIDWRARAAIPFYRATLAEPMGLDRRRRFVFADDELVDVMEEDFNDPGGLSASSGVPDPLLAELGRARTGRMRDIAATIQAEQDVIIRTPLEHCLIVQGGPGTGKTAVGLHRAAYLLFEHRERLMRSGVLVLGPNRLFLDYVGQVLPTLGERSVRQATIPTLLGRYRIAGTDDPATGRVKADPRMAVLLERVATDFVSPADADLSFPFGARVAVVRKEQVNAHMQVAMASKVPWADRRVRFRNSVLRSAMDSLPDEVRMPLDFEKFSSMTLAGSGRRALDRCWRSTNGANLVRRLLTNRTALARAADGILDRDEQATLFRRRTTKGVREPWTEFDLPLLDEADAFVAGHTQHYGHIVVDEAQDRTPMELRLLGRRATAGSMTILGDLAQATNVAAVAVWEDAARHLSPPQPAQIAQLTIGYRLPGALLDFANRLLPHAAPNVAPAVSVRETGDHPHIEPCDPGELYEQVGELVSAFVRRYSTIAVISPLDSSETIARQLAVRDIPYVTDGGESLDDRVAVLSATQSKGLEFDAVIVVEPKRIMLTESGKKRALFVALTRAVQHLSIFHTMGLPDELEHA